MLALVQTTHFSLPLRPLNSKVSASGWPRFTHGKETLLQQKPAVEASESLSVPFLGGGGVFLSMLASRASVEAAYSVNLNVRGHVPLLA